MVPAKRSKKSKAKVKAAATPTLSNKRLETEAAEALFSATPSRSHTERQADVPQDSEFRSNRAPMHSSVSMLRKAVKTPQKAATIMDPASAASSRHASPGLSSDIGFYDPTDVEIGISDDSDAESGEDTTLKTEKKRNRSIRSVGGSIEQEMTEKTARYLEAWTRNTSPWAGGTDLSSAIIVFWRRCQESFGRDLELSSDIKRHLRDKVNNVRSHLQEKCKKNILKMYELEELSAEDRAKRVKYLLEHKRFLRRPDGYEDGHWRFLAPQIPQLIYLNWFASLSCSARRNPMAWLDRMTPTTAAFVCTSLWFSLTMFQRKGIEEKKSNGKPLLSFSGKAVIDMYNDISRHWKEMSENMKRICLQQIKKGILERFDAAVKDEIPVIVETVPLPDDAEAKMLAEFGDDPDLVRMLSQTAAQTANKGNTVPVDLTGEDETLDEPTSPMISKRPYTPQANGSRKRRRTQNSRENGLPGPPSDPFEAGFEEAYVPRSDEDQGEQRDEEDGGNVTEQDDDDEDEVQPRLPTSRRR